MLEHSPQPHLTMTVEKLIGAANLEVDSPTQKKLVDNLDSLKTSFASNLNTAVQRMESSNVNFDANVKTLYRNLSDVKTEIEALRSELNQHVASIKSEILALKRSKICMWKA